jgi:hypothetical protein
VKVACGDTDDVRPVTDMALPVVVVSHGDHGTVGLNPHRVMLAAGDLGNGVKRRFKWRCRIRLSTAYHPGN